MIGKPPRKFKAWLVTWEWIGNHAKRDDKVAAVLDPRLSPSHVREFVELFYLNVFYGIGERVYYGLHRHKNPFTARVNNAKDLSWPPFVDCGDNPFLVARLVKDLTVEPHEDGTETATWTDQRTHRRYTFRTRK